MRLLLDTQIYLWHSSQDEVLSDKTKSLILNAESIHISTVTLWEIAIKVRLGKLNADLDKLISNLHPSGFHELPVTARHAAQVAHAMREQLHLVTTDSHLPQYGNLVIRV